jgi:ribosomal protein L4
VYDIMRSEKLVLTKAALQAIEERLGAERRESGKTA